MTTVAFLQLRVFSPRHSRKMTKRQRDERIAAARAEIARRIKRVCEGLSQADLDKLLDRMAMLQYKYDVSPNLPAEPPDAEPTGEHRH